MNRKLRFGMQFDFRNPAQWQKPWAKFYHEMIEFAAWTEKVGFDDIWLSEHHGSEDGYMPSVFMAAAAIAQKTDHCRIGTAVALAPFYHPLRLAEDCAVLDIISNGRLDVGLGLGYAPHEFLAYGVPREKRGAIFTETLEIIRRLWDGETLTFDSPHFQLSNARVFPRPVQTRLPVWVGGNNRATMDRAVRFGDGIIGGGDIAQRYSLYVEALAAANRPASDVQMIAGDFTWLVVSQDPERTRHRIAPHVLHSVQTYIQWNQTAANHTYSKIQSMDLDQLMASPILQVVTPEDAIKLIKVATDTAPISGIYGMIPPAGFPLDELAEHVELFAKTVIPAFR